jgi:hypothetical protein
LLFRTVGSSLHMSMPRPDGRKVFLVVAGGNPAAERHFEDTIQRKRTLLEVRKVLPSQQIENLENIYHGADFIVWGAVPGPMNGVTALLLSKKDFIGQFSRSNYFYAITEIGVTALQALQTVARTSKWTQENLVVNRAARPIRARSTRMSSSHAQNEAMQIEQTESRIREVLRGSPSGPMTIRSILIVLCDSGSQICGSLLTGTSSPRGSAPDHFTVPVIVPPLVTSMTV